MQLRARNVNNYDLYANHAWYVPGVRGMFSLLGMFLLGNIMGILVTSVMALFMSPQALMNYGTLVVYPLSFLPPMVYAANKSTRNSLFEAGYKLNSSHFGPFKVWQLALITVALTFSYSIVADLPNYLNYKLTTSVSWMNSFYESVKAMLDQMTGGPLWSSFLLAAVFAPVFEEWLCRGMVLRGLLTKMKPVWAIVISALFFALIHMNPWQALNAFGMGVIMGYVYYKSGSLLLTMLIHFVNNATAVFVSQFTSQASDMYFFEMMDRSTYVLVYIAGLAVMAACIIAFKRIPLEQKRGNVDVVEIKVD